MVNLVQFDPISQWTPLTMIPLKGTHCTLKDLFLNHEYSALLLYSGVCKCYQSINVITCSNISNVHFAFIELVHESVPSMSSIV